jgi:DNA-binding CsgD family transcriptional regulator/tetratricopeptide (TPR) repeat protein
VAGNNLGLTTPSDSQLERGRAAYANGSWRAAYSALSALEPQAPEDSERLATAAYMLGRDDDYVLALERAHLAYRERGEPLRAARCAFWIAINLILRGEIAPAGGWLSRARRLVEREPGDCVERGYLLLPLVFERRAQGRDEDAIAAAAEAAAIGERFHDADLFALATHDHGLLLIDQGRVAEGLRLLDEAMVAVTAGELSPIVNGYVYCGVILGCRVAHEPRRAQEWTAALTSWCEQQPDMVSFTGTCLVHRAELLQLHGSWDAALAEARRARERCAAAANESGAAEASYREGELHRLRGDFERAEAAYRDASRGGREPQPGLALLRLAQGDLGAAVAAMRRLLDETTSPARRAGILPAYVEVMVAAGEAARDAVAELEELAWGGEMLAALSAYARGAVQLADDPRAALISLRVAEQSWRELNAPYEAARTRVLVALACRALGDEESAGFELAAAREAFAALGAEPDVARVDALAEVRPLGLTGRELEVLRLLAAGRSNREIAGALVISEHTVARHVQNMFAKLGVSSRTAASALAHKHGLN